VLDNLSAGFLNNLGDLITLGKIEFINGDICDYEVCLKSTSGVDFVLHNAALGSVSRSIIEPLRTNRVNVDGFLNVLHAAKENRVKRFVYASSSSVYGDDLSMPKTELNTGNQLSPYAVSKFVNEKYAKVYSKVYNLETVGLRYFNVFGPRQNVAGPYAAVIPRFIDAMLKFNHCNIYGNGENTRDFTFVENVVLANILAAVSEKIKFQSPVINIAYGNTVSINVLFEMLSKITGNKLKPNYVEERIGEIKDSFADISLAQKLLDYNPKIDLEQGLSITYDWFKKTLMSF
jgi:UDP-N-acetylglucosamine 4-epimerase